MTRKVQIKEASINYQLSTRPMAIGGDAFADDARKLNVNTSFIAGAEWADAHPNWLSVEDELPPLYEFFFYFGKNGVVRIMNCNNVHHGRNNEEYLKDCIDCGFITHWMPLTAPPMKGDQGND